MTEHTARIIADGPTPPRPDWPDELPAREPIVPPDAAAEYARSRAEGRDSVESAVRALIPGTRL